MADLKYFESLAPNNSREKEIKQYLEYLKKGLSAQIIGLPGSGKSNILRLLAYNSSLRTHYFQDYERIVHFVYMDSSEVSSRELTDLVKFIFSSISFSLNERSMSEDAQKVKELLKEGLSYNDDLLLFQYLKKAVDYLTIEKKLTLVLLFDRFDSIAPNLKGDFFSNLRSLRNNAKYRFETVFSLKRPLEETIDIKILSDFHDLVTENEIYVKLYDPVSVKFRLDYIEKAARNTLDEKVRKQIIELTNGHSKLTKVSFEKAISEQEKINDLKTYLLSSESIKKALNEIWESLMPGEKEALKGNLPFEEIKQSHPYLVNSGLVTPEGISIPLFKEYVENITIETSESIKYDPEHNEILKGDASISKNLSPSEFRLLKFLLDNEGKILTKDEIISSIWKEQKTQEGVTDQALDQILYRLRKKIERDPSSPQLIQTIKGRGYKFSY